MSAVTIDSALVIGTVPLVYLGALLFFRHPQKFVVPGLPPRAFREALAKHRPAFASRWNGLQLGSAAICAVAVISLAIARVLHATAIEDDQTSEPTLEQWYAIAAACVGTLLAMGLLVRELSCQDPMYPSPSLELRLGWLILAACAIPTLSPQLEEHLMRNGGDNSAFERDSFWATSTVFVVAALLHLAGPLRYMDYSDYREGALARAAIIEEAGGLEDDAYGFVTPGRSNRELRTPARADAYAALSTPGSGYSGDSSASRARREDGESKSAPYDGSNPLAQPLLSDADRAEGEGGEACAAAPRKSPELYASPVGYFTFAWLNELVATGYKRALTLDDLYPLHPREAAPVLAGDLRAAWEQELQHKAPGERSLARAMHRAFGSTFAAAVAFKLIYDSLLFVGPQLLNLLIKFIQDTEDDDVRDPPISTGYTYVALMFVSAIVQSTVLHQYFHRAYRTGMRLKSSVTSLVFEKALRIRPGAVSGTDPDAPDAKAGSAPAGKGRENGGAAPADEAAAEGGSSKKSSGEIVNLMSVDAQRMQDLMAYFAMLFSAPYQISLSVYFLWGQLGPAVFAGVGVMLCVVPVTGFVASRSRQLQKGLMRVKDERIKVTNEVLAGIKIIKLYAWERPFGEKIDGIREDELRALWKYQLWSLMSRFLWTVVPIMVSVAAFATFTLTGGELTPARAFTALALFNILRFPLATFPMMISNTVEASLSVARLRAFLETDEVKPLPALPPAGAPAPGKPLVEVEEAELAWDDGTPLLDSVSLRVRAGECAMVIGATGSGKSSLLGAVIGDMEPLAGRIRTAGRIAYVAQSAWIQNGSLRDNVLFGAPWDAAWYNEVLRCCALLPDLQALPAGDATEIGEKGINLSGGQKQRVALARAVYADADVYLLDDCMSAVDSQVGAHIFEHCVKGLLRGKAVVMVTHGLHMLPHAATVLLLQRRGAAASEDAALGSTVAFHGAYDAFMQSGHPFAAMAKSAMGGAAAAEGAEAGKRAAAPEVEAAVAVGDGAGGKGAASEEDGAGGEGRLIEREGVAVGKVGFDVYKSYMSAAGGVAAFALIPGGLVCTQSFLVGTNYWLSYWSDHAERVGNERGLLVYSVLTGGGALSTLATLLVVAVTSVAAARVFHRNLMDAMLRAPMAFFDTTPLGRILNRFSKDTYTIDEQLMSAIYMWLNTLVAVLSIVIVISFATPFFLLCLLPLGAFYMYTQNYYIPTSRELKRLDSVSRSPIFSAFSEVLEGVSTIRAFRAEQRFVAEEHRRLDANLRAYYLYVASNRWLAMRLEFVGTCIVTFAALLAVVARHEIPAGLAALSVSYALNVTQSLNWMVRMTSDRESYIVSVERVKEYAETEPEARADTPEESRPPAGWPSAGELQLSGVDLRYRPGLPLVLRGLEVSIAPGQRIGVCGRTGAGKSSLLLALLRLVEPERGTIRLDGIDLRGLGLDDVRGRVSIIPQDPVLFTGTVRANIDPFLRATDAEVWSALDRAHLGDHIRVLPGGLSAEVEEGGRNFSLGERQMLCFARALIRRSKLLLLDEATSAVDPATDTLIQQTLSEEFNDTTIIAIAHRLQTIRDSDVILVMDAGVVGEAGTHEELVQRGGIYADLVKAEESR